MAITRVKPGSWIASDRLTRAEITQLDKNMSYTIDTVSGHTDAISSDLTVDATGSITGATGMGFVIDDPADVTIADGYLSIDAELVGKLNPTNFGYYAVALSPTGTTVLPAAAYRGAADIRLTGAITADVTLTIPAEYGYVKLFQGAFTTFYNYTVTITTGSGEVVVLNSNSNVLIYCNGTDVYEVSKYGYPRLADQAKIKFNCNGIAPTSGAITIESPDVSYIRYGGKIGLVAGATSTLLLGEISPDVLTNTDFFITDFTVNGKIVFIDGRAGDRFEVFLACGVQRSPSTTNTLSWIAPYVEYGTTWTAALGKYFAPKDKQGTPLYEAMIPTENDTYHYGAGSTIFTAPYNGTYEFKTYMYYDMLGQFMSFPVTAFGPLQLVVKQWRF